MEAVHAVLDGPAGDPAAAVERAHRRMGHTRGGALAVVQVTGPVVRFCGLGNIAAVILANGSPQEHALGAGDRGAPGPRDPAVRVRRAAGRGRHPALRRPQQPLEPGGLPGVTARDPLVVAAALLAEAGTRRDDASVLVLKP